MSYAPTTDFLALVRLLPGGGVRTERMPGTDYLLAAMSRAGMFNLSVSQSAPVLSQSNTVWLKPSLSGSWTEESDVFLWDAGTSSYASASPPLWAALFAVGQLFPSIVQEITAPGPANISTDANIVRVNQLVSAPIDLILPLSATKTGGVLVVDWKYDAGAGNDIRVNLIGTDVLPGGGTQWTIAANGGSAFFRPLPGGYVL